MSMDSGTVPSEREHDHAVTTLGPEVLAQIRAEGVAQRGTGRFEDPDVIAAYIQVLLRRGEAWAASVLGRESARRSLTWGPWLEPAEPEILVLADQRESEQAGGGT